MRERERERERQSERYVSRRVSVGADLSEKKERETERMCRRGPLWERGRERATWTDAAVFHSGTRERGARGERSERGARERER